MAQTSTAGQMEDNTMREMIYARKAQLEKRGIKGFTLMEMLIVIAIIAVLVAIAIPIFTAQLSNARAETDAANIRSGYATATATILSNNVTETTTYYLNSDGSVSEGSDSVTSGSYTCKAAYTDLSDQSQSIAGTSASTIAWSKGSGIEYKWNGKTLTISTY
jgi:type IV pilus assembly protein PilA